MITLTQSNKISCLLDNLEVGETFRYEDKIGLVTEVTVYDAEWDYNSKQRCWIDVLTGKDLVKNNGEPMYGTEFIEPINLYLTIQPSN